VRRVLAPKWWLLHLFVLAAVLAMLRLGLWQWHRANSPSGGVQNYAYAFQWPLFACFAIVMWVKTLLEEVRRPAEGAVATRAVRRPMPDHPVPIVQQPGVRVGITTAPIEADEDDVELAEWNARFAALNARQAAAENRKR
jgi:DNA-binding transcriptional regulator of glucitol operon